MTQDEIIKLSTKLKVVENGSRALRSTDIEQAIGLCMYALMLQESSRVTYETLNRLAPTANVTNMLRKIVVEDMGKTP